jgi:hypothetical protein
MFCDGTETWRIMWISLKRSMCWQLRWEELNTSIAEVWWKIHIRRNQVSNSFPIKYCMYCVLCVKWAIVCTLQYVHECAVSFQACLGMVMYLGSVLVFHFLCERTYIHVHTLACVSCDWGIFFILALYGKVKWLNQNMWLHFGSSQLLTWDRIKKKEKWVVNLFFTLCVSTCSDSEKYIS